MQNREKKGKKSAIGVEKRHITRYGKNIIYGKGG